MPVADASAEVDRLAYPTATRLLPWTVQIAAATETHSVAFGFGFASVGEGRPGDTDVGLVPDGFVGEPGDGGPDDCDGPVPDGAVGAVGDGGPEVCDGPALGGAADGAVGGDGALGVGWPNANTVAKQIADNVRIEMRNIETPSLQARSRTGSFRSATS